MCQSFAFPKVSIFLQERLNYSMDDDLFVVVLFSKASVSDAAAPVSMPSSMASNYYVQGFFCGSKGVENS